MLKAYFIQTQPSPDEGAHAQEVSKESWIDTAYHNELAPIEYDENSGGLYLRLDKEV